MAGNWRRLVIIFMGILVSGIFAYAQIRETGIIQGNVTDEEGMALPGVSVKIESPNLIGGVRVLVTDAKGFYKCPALMIGTYKVTVDLSGFGTIIKEGINLHGNVTLTVDFKMAPAKLQNEVVVLGERPTVDVKSSTTGQTIIPSELLMALPLPKEFSAMLNMATGVQTDNYTDGYQTMSAFGQKSSANSYQFDGIDVSGARDGTMHFAPDSNALRETSVAGLGLPAEFGGYTGVVLSGITKSGSNKLSTLDEFWYNGQRWNSQNLGRYTEDQFYSPEDKNKKFESGSYFDSALQVGGKFIQDKLWFFLSAEHRRTFKYPLGTVEEVKGIDTRVFGKMTYQLTHSTRMNFSLSFDNGILYNGYAGPYTSPEADANTKDPGWFGNLNLTSVLSPDSVLEVKFGYNQKVDSLEPKNGHDLAGHLDFGTNLSTVNFMNWYDDHEKVFDLHAHLSQYFRELLGGSHDAKFGAEFKYSLPVYTLGIPGGAQYYDFLGEPYQYTSATPPYSSLNHYITNFNSFAQDRWTLGKRLTLNLGLRFDYLRYKIPGLGAFLHQNNLSPRLGFAFDVLGDRKNVIKFHYGHYFDKVFESTFVDLDRRTTLWSVYLWNGTDYEFAYSYNSSDPSLYSVDPGLKWPYMREFSGGFERELFRDASLSVNFYFRKTMRFLGYVDTRAQWQSVTITNPGPDAIAGTADDLGDLTIYERLNYGEDAYLLTNPRKGQSQAMIDDPKFSAKGLEVIFSKRFSHRWQMVASYHYTKTVGNTSGTSFSGSTPNGFVNTYGIQGTGYGQPHQFKVQGSVLLPLDIDLGILGHWSSGSNRNLTTYQVIGFDFILFNLVPPGTYKYGPRRELDIRIQKHFNLRGGRLSLMGDITNLFNSDRILAQAIYAGPDFGKIASVVSPRQFRIGIRFIY